MQKFRHGVSDREDQVGAVTGLAWTEEVGGELLTIEAVTASGRVRVRDGQARQVTRIGAGRAVAVKARARPYGIKPSLFARKDIHIHLPEGAVPKDGPSAGVGMVTAMVSTLTGIAVRKDVAMTGEVTLRGRVSRSAGSRKSCSRRCAGASTTVLIPEENEKDLVEIGEHHQSAEDPSGGPRRPGTGRSAGGRTDRMDRSRRPRRPRPRLHPVPTPKGTIRH